MIYSSIDNPNIKEIKKLNKKKYRDEKGLFLIEGDHLIKEAYQYNCLDTLILLEGNDINIEVNKIYVTLKVMKYLSELDCPSKMIGVCHKSREQYIGNKVVILDNIQDPGNLGTIIRSCVAFNCDTLIISNNSVDLYNSKVVRASQGMLFHLNIIVCDIESKIKDLLNKGYKIIGTDVNNGSNIKNFEKVKKFAIIMGNEGKGVSPSIRNLCNDFVYIDMNQNCESLNVGVATSILLYELNK